MSAVSYADTTKAVDNTLPWEAFVLRSYCHRIADLPGAAADHTGNFPVSRHPSMRDTSDPFINFAVDNHIKGNLDYRKDIGSSDNLAKLTTVVKSLELLRN